VEEQIVIKNRDGEKGAAMVMALMVSFLLLVASAGLIMESSMNTQNVTDATAEQQAYNAAESGIQSAINVLRGNVAPAPLFDASKPASDPANKVTYVRALKNATGNTTGDTTGYSRMSRWLGYSSGSCADRVIIGGTTCDPLTGFGYSLTIADPDNTGGAVSYTTNAKIFDTDTGNANQITYGTAPNTIRIKYTPVSVADLNTLAGPAATNFGTFDVKVNGTGTLIPAFNRFEIVVQMTKPYNVRRVIRGYIETNTSANNPPKIIFDAQTYTLEGSVITLNFAWGSPSNVAVAGPPQRYGYEATLSAVNPNVVTGTMTSPEPTRLLIKSMGYGPRGAKKRLEAIIQKDLFNGLTAPATLTLVGPPSTVNPATTFNFDPGSSNVTVYSGDDVVTTDIIPPVGTTYDDTLSAVEDSIAGLPPHPFNGNIIGAASNVTPEIPEWLTSPVALDATIQSLATIASSSGRFFASGQQPTTFGDNATAQGITFCDGSCSFTGNGGGILVVTGTLTLSGNFSFNGLILVTGQNGVLRSGGGTGTIQGNMVIAPYVGASIAGGVDPLPSATFLAPQYDLSGGGNSNMVYNSSSVAGGLVAVSNFVLGVMEK
jgi:hypothetical protein